MQWNGLTDMTDARLLAPHLLWASTVPQAANQDFNVVNGDVFRWSWMWERIAAWFGLEPAPFDGTIRPLEQQMAGDAPLWAGSRRSTTSPRPSSTASPRPGTRMRDLGRPMEVVTDMSKSRRLGFLDYQPTEDPSSTCSRDCAPTG